MGRERHPVARTAWFPAALFAAAVLAAMIVGGVGTARAAAGEGSVHRLEITGEIDLGLAPFLDRVLTAAERDGAAAVILVVDTPGGRLDAVLQMRDALLDTPVPTVAFVDRTAFSAGALVALASDRIHVVPGGVIGAATPVDASGVAAEEKVVSAVRSTFGATAEEQGREPRVAEAMVDPDVEIDGLTDADSLLTLTSSEAIEVGYADGVARDLDELLEQLGLSGRPIVEHEVSLAERAVRFITNPIVASLLITVGVWLLVGDLLVGGIGIGAVAGLGSLGLFFWGHHLAGLAGWEDVALLGVGVVLIAVELFVVPGFGVAGVVGLLALLGGAFLAMLHRDLTFATDAAVARAATTVGVSFLAIIAGFGFLLWYLGRRRGGGGMVLRAAVASSRDPAPSPSVVQGTAQQPRFVQVDGRQRSDSDTGLDGATGIAVSDLRPSGIAEIGGQRVDVVTEGEYIAAGESIEILLDEGYRRVVRRRDG